MRLLYTFLAFTAPSLITCSTFNLPDASKAPQQEGVWSAKLNATGHTIFELLAHPDETQREKVGAPPLGESFPADLSSLRRRATGHAFCGCGFNMNHGECDAAVADLKDQVSRRGTLWLGGGLCWYSIRGGAVAFICNPYSGTNTNGFTADGIGLSTSIITGDCGWYTAGTHAWGYYKSLLVGYMIYRPGLDFFGDAMSSDSQHC